jgi:hypothetical protein
LLSWFRDCSLVQGLAFAGLLEAASHAALVAGGAASARASTICATAVPVAAAAAILLHATITAAAASPRIARPNRPKFHPSWNEI